VPRLSELGYDALQLSPLQKSIDGSQWWARYQPVSHEQIEGLGSAEELKELCKKCGEHGITVIADVVFNHMAVVAPRHDWLRAQKSRQFQEELMSKLVPPRPPGPRAPALAALPPRPTPRPCRAQARLLRRTTGSSRSTEPTSTHGRTCWCSLRARPPVCARP
jgi:hypothetical protein